jgi:nanoRNase/pAp phosphatase (c-di-AMP/oligoRNAs hydrolase)
LHILEEIKQILDKDEILYLQTHNFPDHDAVASAFGLQVLFKVLGVETRIIYEGEIQRQSLHEMIRQLEIRITHNEDHGLCEKDKILIVDGCKGNKNVTDLVGDEIGVIDHHRTTAPDDVPFSDIRPGYGACSSIVASYFEDLSIEVPRNAATALMIGINMDTALLTRGVSEEDIDQYSRLYKISDVRLQNTVLRNYIQTKDLKFYHHVIENMTIIDNIAYCFFDQGCNQNLMGILGDFLLALEEVEFVILGARNRDKVNYSLRSENEKWNAAAIIQEALQGIGFGGGHFDMAGGIIQNLSVFDEAAVKRRLLRELRERR